MNKTKHIPERTCIGCRKKSDKSSFIKVVTSSGQVYIDVKGNMDGRGFYICNSKSCLDRLKKNKAFAKRYKDTAKKIIENLENTISE